jgi:hypothetical protein
MKKVFLSINIALIIAFFFHNTQNVSAAELLVNGSFETGDFTGWTITNASGGWMNWQNTTAGNGGGFNPPYVTAPQHGTRSVWNGVTANANQQYIMYQQVTIPAATSAFLTWKDRFQMNLADFCTSAAACGTATYVVDITNTSGTVLQTLYTVNAPALAKTDTGWKGHGIVLSAYAGQTIRIRFRSWGSVTFAGPGQAEIDAVSLQSPIIPSAANISVSGKVTTYDGTGISRANVTLTDESGVVRNAVTNGFGYYSFDEVTVGGTYVLNVNHKSYTFPDSPLVISPQDNFTSGDFRANP